MTAKYIKGAALSVVTIGGGMFLLLSAWNAWLTNKTVNNEVNTASITKWQEIYGKRIDFLVERNGANPDAVTRFYENDAQAINK